MGSRGRRDDGPCFFLYELDELDECLRPLSEERYEVRYHGNQMFFSLYGWGVRSHR
jgi:hypothetical protein